MALQPGSIATAMASLILSNMQELDSKAEATQFQSDLSKACAEGLCNAMTQQAIGIGGVGPPAAGPGVGISSISARSMVSGASAYMQQNTGSKGAALEPLLDGIFTPMVKALATVTVTSESGFGGQCTSISGLTVGSVTSLILAGFSADARQKLTSSRGGKILVEAVATGFVNQVSTGIPGIIPVGTGTPGPTIAKFS